MPGYVILIKLTGQGHANIKDAPKAIGQGKELAAKLGIQHVGTWVTLGQYDAITVLDAPNEQAVATWVLTLGQQGAASTQTMRAFSEDEFAEVVAALS